MFLISPTMAIILIVVILGIAILVAWWKQDYESYDKGAIHTFIVVFAGLGVLVTFAFYMNLLLLQEQQQELTAIQEETTISDTMLNSIMDSMNTASVIIPAFVMSVNPLTNTVCCPGGSTGGTGCNYTPTTDPENPQTCTEKMTLSYRIFSLWQDTLLLNGYVQENQLSYISNFLQRANSEQLHQQWLVSKLNFNPNTQALGDLLFEYGLPITIQIPDSYIQAANKLIADPRYQSIIN